MNNTYGSRLVGTVNLIKDKLSGLITNPELWGEPHSVQDQTLQLMEVLYYIVTGNDPKRKIYDRFVKYAKGTTKDRTCFVSLVSTKEMALFMRKEIDIWISEGALISNFPFEKEVVNSNE